MRQLIIPLILFALLMAFFWWGINDIDAASQNEKLRGVERAITRAVVQCYALEMQYPSNIAYLREHYGLIVDEEKYIIHYDFFGGNIMPQIIVKHREW